MKTSALGIAAFAALAFAAMPASAASIFVANHSFETLPQAGLTFGGCGTGCSYSIDAVPGWGFVSGVTGQFQPGTDQGNFAYFSTLADGPTSAYSNGGSIIQDVGVAAVAGKTYKLVVSLGARNDIAGTGQIALSVGASTVFATGIAPTAGNWSDYSAVYTAQAGDAGGPILITLTNAGGGQGNWDNVRLAAVPEPATWALMIIGFGAIGVTARRRAAATSA